MLQSMGLQRVGHLMQLPREEKEEGDRGDQDKKRGNQKERDRSSQ